MKYIRTKDGIEKLDADREHLTEYMNGKQANTIEELVDEFVIDFGKTNYPTTNRYKRYADFENLKKEIEDREKNFYRYLNIDFIVYGAIWTNKGLIYVAKMNEKGELELL